MSRPSSPTPVVRLYETTDPSALWPELLKKYGEIAPVELEPGVHGWLLLSWRLNWEVMRDHQTYARDPDRWAAMTDGRIGPQSPLRILFGKYQSALYSDGAEHERYRNALLTALKSLTFSQVVQHITAAADQLIDAFCLHGKADLVTQYTRQLPVTVLCRLFGLGPAEVMRICLEMQAMWGEGPDAFPARLRIAEMLTDLARRRRRAPGNDLASSLVAQGLSDVEVRDNLLLIIAAADDPVTHLIGNTIRMLLVDSGVRARLATSSTLIAETVNTALWTDPPLQTLIGRYPVQDVRLVGAHVRAGDCLVLGFAAASLDLMARSGPDAMLTNRAHLTWGVGPHTCPVRGQDMALAIAETAVDRLLRRLPDLALSVPPDQLRWRPSLTVRGLEALPVRFTPVPVSNPGGTSWDTPAAPTPSISTPPAESTSPPKDANSSKKARWYGWLFPGTWRSGH
ncbi:MAG TPA: cytochrome P450 [Thermobifida alba]|nr:cytochrome P450 [Thermobifida alba]